MGTRKIRIPWSQIREMFAGEWVELTDFRWDWNSPSPTWAVVRHHASDRKTLLKKIRMAGRSSEEALIIYIGATHPLIRRPDAVANL